MNIWLAGDVAQNGKTTINYTSNALFDTQQWWYLTGNSISEKFIVNIIWLNLNDNVWLIGTDKRIIHLCHHSTMGIVAKKKNTFDIAQNR